MSIGLVWSHRTCRSHPTLPPPVTTATPFYRSTVPVEIGFLGVWQGVNDGGSGFVGSVGRLPVCEKNHTRDRHMPAFDSDIDARLLVFMTGWILFSPIPGGMDADWKPRAHRHFELLPARHAL